jgi:hypothetical protein
MYFVSMWAGLKCFSVVGYFEPCSELSSYIKEGHFSRSKTWLFKSS